MLFAVSRKMPRSALASIPPVERTLIRIICQTESSRISEAPANTQPAPRCSSTGPATGPTTFEPNCIIEASVIALSRAAPFTVLGRSAAWAGISPERMIPEISVTSTRFHSSIVPVKARIASVAAVSAAPKRQSMTTRARS